jgi:hypothetical protein
MASYILLFAFTWFFGVAIFFILGIYYSVKTVRYLLERSLLHFEREAIA